MKQQLGHYDIVSELGRGGMGVVYKGYEASLNRYVAIKVLADSLAHDPAVKERFLREARSMAVLNDPHIIQIYFIGEDEGQTYFVMEFVDGESLGSVLKRDTRLTPEQAARIIYQTAQGLSTAHDRGVVHRDIKPGNLMLTSRGQIKIADFGIALSAQDFSKKLTSTGEFVGTPGYLSPEVCLGKPVDQRSDIFALGIVLFEMLAGRMPFIDESPLGLMLEVVKADIPDVCTLNAEVDPELSRILARMIAKEPADRYQSCQDLIADLARHPLLSSGATVNLRTLPSSAAATLIGQKTPVSGQVPLPSIVPTPRGQALPPTALTPSPNTVITPVPASAAAHSPVLGRQPAAAKSSSALPWAIAAIVLFGCAGGAWAYRTQIPFLNQWLPASLLDASVPAKTDNAPIPVVLASPPAPASVAATPAPPASVPGPDAGAAIVNGGPASPPMPTLPAIPPSPDPIAATPPDLPPAAAVAMAEATKQIIAAGELAEKSGRGDSIAEVAAAAAAMQGVQERVAKIAVPPQPPKPHVPTIAVLSGGDIVVSEPAGRVIERALSHHGYRLLDAQMMPRAEQFLGGQRPNVGGLLDMLTKNGRVDAIVIVHARAAGSAPISFHGQSDTMNTAQLNVSVYTVQGQRKLGPGWSENVNFTALSAKDQAEEAVEEIAPQVEQLLVEYRPGRDRG